MRKHIGIQTEWSVYYSQCNANILFWLYKFAFILLSKKPVLESTKIKSKQKLQTHERCVCVCGKDENSQHSSYTVLNIETMRLYNVHEGYNLFTETIFFKMLHSFHLIENAKLPTHIVSLSIYKTRTLLPWFIWMPFSLMHIWIVKN